MEHILVEIGLQAVNQDGAGLAHAAAQDNCLRIDHRAHVGQEFPEVTIIFVQYMQCQRIAALACVKDILAGNGVRMAQNGILRGCRQRQIGQADNSRGGAVLLNAPALAAAAHGGLVAVEHHMADLCAGAGGAVKELPVNYDTAADACAEGNKHHVLEALSAALPVLAEGRHIGIVSCRHRQARQLQQLLVNIKPSPAEVDAAVDISVSVYRPGDADADPEQVLVRDSVMVAEFPDGLGNVRQNPAAVVRCNRRNLPVDDHLSCFVKIGDFNSGAA